jgi:hypothetical protein
MSTEQASDRSSRGRGKAPIIGASFWRMALAASAGAVISLIATSNARAGCVSAGGLGTYAETDTDFDGTLQTQSACGTYSAIPGVSSVSDPFNGGTATSRANAIENPGKPLTLGAFAQSSGVALSGSANASFNDTIYLTVTQTDKLRAYGAFRARVDGATLNIGEATGTTEPLADLVAGEIYDVQFAIQISGFATEFTGATLDLTFGNVTDVAALSDGTWSVSQGDIQVPSGVGGSFLFNIENVAPPTLEDPANFGLSLTVTAGSDGNTTGEIDLLDPVTVDGVTVYDYLGNIVPSVSAVSGLAIYYPVTDRLVSASAPEPSTWAMMLIGFAGLGFAGYRARRTATAVG